MRAGILIPLALGAAGWIGLKAPAQAPSPAKAPTTGPASVAADPRERERAVVLVLRSVAFAQKSYAASNGGLFDELTCLGEPWKCIPSYSADGAVFLDPSRDWLAPHYGYELKFHPGPVASESDLKGGKVSPSSLKSYALTARLATPTPGLRGLCVDSKARLCVTDDGREPPVRNGLCEPCKSSD